MDIKHNRELFIFPPFCRSKMGKKVNHFAFATHEERAGDDEFQINSHHAELIDEIGADEIDDHSVQFLHDVYAEHDIEEDFDIQEALEENVNGSLPGHDELETDSNAFPHQLNGNLQGDEACFNGFPPLEKDTCEDENKWGQVRKGTKIIVQVVKEGLGTKGPTLTAYPK
ncbi:hypothetical protein NMG60_11007179 [Bertholletia excelsa]